LPSTSTSSLDAAGRGVADNIMLLLVAVAVCTVLEITVRRTSSHFVCVSIVNTGHP
jgi:hypothetical protein